MSRLLRSRAWSVLALLAGITSLWPGEVLWLQLACAAGLAIGISQQLALLMISIRMRMLETLRVRLSSATMLSAAVAFWYLANSPRLPFLVVAGLLVILAGLWWFCTALKDADVVQLQARNLPGVPEEPVNPPRWPYGWAAVVVCGFLVLGFVAATFARGLRFVQVPTTLLAQVDSSVGGKVGINLSGGKNMVGAFHQPRVVLADMDTLATLPDHELRAGLAEVIKHGAIRDAELFGTAIRRPGR